MEESSLHKMACEIKMDAASHMLPKCQTAILKSDSLLYLNMTLSAVRSVMIFLHEHSSVIFASVILVIVLYVLYKCYWNPVFYSKELTDIGFEHIRPGPDRPARVARAQLARKLGYKIPPPYPNGWFAVAESSELRVGGVLAVDVLGQNLCLFRGEDGVARCVDAYCPHLGANLAIGGAVTGNCIQCPFHKWTFGPDGVCKSVPGVEKAPRGVAVKSWQTCEADGAVWIWHDADGREPQWSMGYSPGDWAYRGRNEFVVSAHIQ
ncbi:cholesterol 7-desaturase-like, partial [Ostrinia furnacalis]|uniref:cholesterol 7-desaturase-like n=1 Tax=Ostrinia furnacalis TaxID=93504 RepID=UPI00103DA943